ncbi:ABC transporter permease [Sanguibacter antarcticus]|uniref:ABC-type transport system involved in multi-copper enzyme maturation permease subunit n=1 Tax=Sanguibacter antarcticus TaxID=372484 RepID=A0A2A9E740_9MICO|nr:ABC transporter permease subunit [Sanguibacter antarcticus]PFG34351.1 ABC-type transport system involved in multi-copper enzyme maturation permease subunit [Sanguibacter antarcticus]
MTYPPAPTPLSGSGPYGPGSPPPAPAPGQYGAPPTGPAERGDWSLSWHGVRTVARLELTQRIRSTRWKTALVVWFVVVGGISVLISTAASFGSTYGDIKTGPLIFGLNVFFILFLGLLVTPTLSSSAINGDRNAGTLAILQVTLLTPLEITLGKLLAGWSAALAFLAVSIPFIVWAFFAGGVPVLAVVTTLALLSLVLAVVCAFSLALSSLVTKTSGSTMLSYLTVAGLAFFSFILFLLTLIPMTSEDTVRVQQASAFDSETGQVTACEWQTYETSQVHTERTWWLLAVNPFVMIADASPGGESFGENGADPLAAIRDSVREMRAGQGAPSTSCPAEISGIEQTDPSTAPVWPLGLVFYVLLGAGSVYLTVRRIRIPQRRLARGTRIA